MRVLIKWRLELTYYNQSCNTNAHYAAVVWTVMEIILWVVLELV